MIPQYEFHPDSNLCYHQISMAMPKANNDHFSTKDMKFSRQQFSRPKSPRNAWTQPKLHEFRVFLGYKNQFKHPYGRKIFSLLNFSQFQHLHIADPLYTVYAQILNY